MKLLIVTLWVFSYLVGSIPTAYLLVKKITGKDIRTIGSGNVGGTNAKRAGRTRQEGRILFWCTAVLDSLKGAVPVLVAIQVAKLFEMPTKDIICAITALLVILGHDTMPFLKRGSGKGVGTTIGSFLFLAPIPILIGISIFFLLQFFTETVSRRSLLSGISIVASCVILQVSYIVTLAAAVSVIIMIVKHKDNIKRMLNGQE